MGASLCLWGSFLFMWFYCIRNLLLMSKKIFHPVCSSVFQVVPESQVSLGESEKSTVNYALPATAAPAQVEI